jgi:hypothetical protein
MQQSDSVSGCVGPYTSGQRPVAVVVNEWSGGFTEIHRDNGNAAEGALRTSSPVILAGV